jgi:nucleotide-binding universal stress UspA family protein
MFRTVLTPLDGSPFGEHALPLALAIARRSGGSLRLLNVHPPPAAIYSESPPFMADSFLESVVRERQRAAAVAYLDGVVKRLRADDVVSRLLAEGDVRDVIRQQAECLHADLVVMTTHGRGPLGRLWLGSVADELVRTLPMPVLLVRPSEGAPDFSREPLPRRVLIALDGSPFAEQIIEPAVELGALAGAEFTLVRVVKPVVLPEYALEGGGMVGLIQGMEQLDAEQKRLCVNAEKYLEETAAGLRSRGLTAHTATTVDPQPSAGILREAQKADADLMALATHGRRGLSRLVLGSVADKVVRGGRPPVLLRRPHAAANGEVLP